MAWDVQVVRKDVHGSSRFVILSCTADAAEAAVDTGLSFVYGYGMGHTSMNTGAYVQYNKGSTSTALNGFLGCSGFAAGDTVLFTIWGR